MKLISNSLNRSLCYATLLSQFHHHIWNLYILACLILSSDLEDYILLVVWNWLPADGLNEVAQPNQLLASW